MSSDFTQHAGTKKNNHESLTPEAVRKILTNVVKDKTLVIPRCGMGDIESLTLVLNQLRSRFRFGIEVTNYSQERARSVSNAVAVLRYFFAARRRAYKVRGSYSEETIKDEERLRSEFARFLNAMRTHKFELDMDAGLLMPRIESWHPFAEIIASQFREAMKRANTQRTLGNSNQGPVARFVAAVIPHITGEHPSVGAVAKRLKDQARRRKGGSPRP